MNLSPIALFVYKRLEHTKKTIESLQNNFLANESELFIFSDAAKNQDETKAVQQVRNYIKNVSGFKKITIKEQTKNQGLAQSIIAGVTEILNQSEKIIVLEDDLVTSPYFLGYMNEALELYKEDEQIMHIAGYFFPITSNLPTTFFYNQTSCWGWGTWARAWKNFNGDAKKLHQEIKQKKLIKKFNLDGANPNFERQLLENINGRIKTWAIKWQASVFLKNGLCLHPNQSLVQNIGFDGSGENCRYKDAYKTKIINEKILIERMPLKESKLARKTAKKFFYSQKPTLAKRLINLAKKII